MRRQILWLAILLIGAAQLFAASVYAEATPTYELSAGRIANGQVTLTLSGKDVVDFYGYEATLSYDSDFLELLEFKSTREGFGITPIIKNNSVIIAHTKIGNVAGDRGNITIGTLTFKLKKYGESIVLMRVRLASGRSMM